MPSCTTMLTLTLKIQPIIGEFSLRIMVLVQQLGYFYCNCNVTGTVAVKMAQYWYCCPETSPHWRGLLCTTMLLWCVTCHVYPCVTSLCCGVPTHPPCSELGSSCPGSLHWEKINYHNIPSRLWGGCGIFCLIGIFSNLPLVKRT